MKQLAIDICIYCCGKADRTREIDDIIVGLCKEHINISNNEIKEIIGDVKKLSLDPPKSYEEKYKDPHIFESGFHCPVSALPIDKELYDALNKMTRSEYFEFIEKCLNK
jgi:hypothetical protein